MKLINKTAIAAAIFAITGGAQAASVNSLLFGGEQLLSDDSAEYMISGPNDSNSSTLDVGDKLRGIFEMESSTNSLTSGQVAFGNNGDNELTGLFEVEVVAKFDHAADVVTCQSAANALLPDVLAFSSAFSACTAPGVETDGFTFVFGPSSTFAAEVVLEGWGTVGAGVAVVWFDDAANDFSRTGGSASACAAGADGLTIAEAEACATNGDVLWTSGYDGSLGVGWVAETATDEPALIGAGAASAGQFNVSMNVIEYVTGREIIRAATSTIDGVTATDFAGQGNLLTTVGDTPYDLFNDMNITVNVVPAPATLALMGLGLLGLGMTARRRKV